MMARMVAVNKTALAKARERRRQLDRERDAQDQRIEEATALALVALDGLAEAEAGREAAAAKVREAVREMLAEDLTAERAAALLDIDVSDVRRLTRAAPTDASEPSRKTTARPARANASGEPNVTALPAAGTEDAARRVG